MPILVERSRINKALRDCQERGLEVLKPEECVRKAIEEFGDHLCVSCSFGSCSVAVLHLVLQVKPDIKVVFNNTGVEYPETYAYRDLLMKEWNINLIETRPSKSFWECVEKYGFPLYRGKGGKKQGNPGKPACCKYLKELPFKKVAKEHNIEATITGLRAAESRARMFAFGQFGQNYASHKFFDIMKFNPIAFWGHEELWAYLRKHSIPINALYLKGFGRSGCMPCTGFLHWENQLAKGNPAMYRYVQKLRGQELLESFVALEEHALNSCGGLPNQELLTHWFG
jgi:phosphoadenosine phosphosulfate reductase